MKWILGALVLVALNAFAGMATRVIVSDQQRSTLSRSDLLSRHDIQTISVAESVYNPRLTRFKAIPIASLFEGLSIPALAVVQCNGTDGFSAILEQTRLFSTDSKASTAYLAIEDPKHP